MDMNNQLSNAQMYIESPLGKRILDMRVSGKIYVMVVTLCRHATNHASPHHINLLTEIYRH